MLEEERMSQETQSWRKHPELCAWRTGKHPEENRGVYAVQPGRAYYQEDHDVLLGFMDTGDLAAVVVDHHNQVVGKYPPERRHEP
jgi:hypothetical protein